MIFASSSGIPLFWSLPHFFLAYCCSDLCFPSSGIQLYDIFLPSSGILLFWFLLRLWANCCMIFAFRLLAYCCSDLCHPSSGILLLLSHCSDLVRCSHLHLPLYDQRSSVFWPTLSTMLLWSFPTHSGLVVSNGAQSNGSKCWFTLYAINGVQSLLLSS